MAVGDYYDCARCGVKLLQRTSDEQILKESAQKLALKLPSFEKEDVLPVCPACLDETSEIFFDLRKMEKKERDQYILANEPDPEVAKDLILFFEKYV